MPNPYINNVGMYGNLIEPDPRLAELEKQMSANTNNYIKQYLRDNYGIQDDWSRYPIGNIFGTINALGDAALLGTGIGGAYSLGKQALRHGLRYASRELPYLFALGGAKAGNEFAEDKFTKAIQDAEKIESFNWR